MIALKEIDRAAKVVEGRVIRTPLVYSPAFSKMNKAHVYLKLENLQNTGSFKLRGATYKILSHFDRIGPKGVVAASAGNHAQGVALAAARAGLPSIIVMPEWASLSKQQATKSYGGEVILEGHSIGESIRKAQELALTDGRTFIHPFDDEDIITGQGTIGLEILQDIEDPDFIIVPIGGGGLIAGIATAVKTLRSRVKVIGVQAAACPSAFRALEAGKVTRVEARRSIADGIAVKQIGTITYSIIRDLVDEVILVEEDEIAEAILMLLERKRILAEGAGAVSLAALNKLAGRLPEGSKVVLVISGGNVDSPLLDRVIRQGLFRHGRMVRFSVCLDDVPGTLASLLSFISRLKANVLHIHHDRSGGDLPVYRSRVELELETRGQEHVSEIVTELKKAGYDLQSRPHDCFPF